MIRINLLGGDRQRTVKAPAFDPAQYLTLGCSLILVVAALGVGWWYWSLTEASTRIDQEIAAAQQESLKLQSILAEVQQLEQRRAQVQQRVALIEELRGGQSVPVRLLDHVSRSLPEMLWLTQFEQEQGVVTIQGRSTTLIGLSDFVGNLGQSPLLQKPIEIVNSQVAAVSESGPRQGPAVDLISFTVRAQLATPSRPLTDGRGGGPNR